MGALLNYQIVHIILKVYPPVIIIFGTFANAICMIIWGQRVRSSIMAVFLFALSILDTVGLYSLPLWQSLQHWSHRRETMPTSGCIVSTCIYQMIVISTGWIVVFIGFHRACLLCFPDQPVVNKRRAVIMIIVTIIVSLGISSHRLWVDEKEQADMKIVVTICALKTHTEVIEPLKNYRLVLKSYSFNWNLICRLASCFFPATLTLACLIAVQQAVKTLNLENEPNPNSIRRPISKHKKDSVRMFYFQGLTLLICVVPLTLGKIMMTGLEASEDFLAYTLLSIPLHFNFAFKLGIYWWTSSSFKQNMSLIFRTGILMKHIRKMNFLRRRSSGMMLPLRLHSVHIVDLCSDSTDSEMSMSPNAFAMEVPEPDRFRLPINGNVSHSDT